MSTKKITHTELVSGCLLILAKAGLYAWQNNTGAARIGKSFIRYGHPGSSDLICVPPDGIFTGIECKVPPDKQNDDQKLFEKKITQNKGRYVVIESFTEMERYIATLPGHA